MDNFNVFMFQFYKKINKLIILFVSMLYKIQVLNVREINNFASIVKISSNYSKDF